MSGATFETASGRPVGAVSAAEMREVDRVAVEELGLQLLQMMENAGRNAAAHVRTLRETEGDAVVVAGNGGNGGGGMACARHLANRGVPVRVVLDRDPAALSGAAARQHGILAEMGTTITTESDAIDAADSPSVVVDALIGYGVSDELRPPAAERVGRMNRVSAPVVSLDVPSGIDATTGATRGVSVNPDRTVTLALPKTGLTAAAAGELVLADIGIPATVYDRLGIEYDSPFGDGDLVELTVREG